MPVYEYTCQSCKTKFEQLVRSMSGDAKAKCPECGSGKTARSLSLFAVGAESGGGSRESFTPASCRSCGNPHGSCGME
ncbi:MAG TPA: zinc ribbon domain-containing protein [Tepidisphaeraceae bacterium]